MRFVSPRPHGDWDLSHALIDLGVGLAVAAASVWMVYTLEILKARHFRALGFKRFAAEPEEDREEAVEEVLSASTRISE